MTQGHSWWHVHRSAKVDSSKKDSGRLVGLIDWLLSAFDLSAILPIGSSLLVLHSLPGPPIVRELMRVSMISSGQGMWFLSVLPQTVLNLYLMICVLLHL